MKKTKKEKINEAIDKIDRFKLIKKLFIIEYAKILSDKVNLLNKIDYDSAIEDINMLCIEIKANFDHFIKKGKNDYL